MITMTAIIAIIMVENHLGGMISLFCISRIQDGHAFCFAGACVGPAVLGEDHVSVLPVHGTLYGASSLRCKYTNSGLQIWHNLF